MKKDKINKESFEFKQLEINELINDIVNLYDGDNHKYLLKLLNLLIKCIHEKKHFEPISQSDLIWIKKITASFHYAQKVTENDEDAHKLVKLMKQAKEIGLTYTNAFTDEVDLF